MVEMVSEDLSGEFRYRLANKTLRIAVVGVGYVGLPQALKFSQAGFRVSGLETDPDRTNRLNDGISGIEGIPQSILQKEVESNRLSFSDDPDCLLRADAILICVPTPLTPQRDPDMSHIEHAAEAIAKRLRRGQLVVLESTTYPNTTEGMLRCRLEESGLKCTQDFFLAFSPEREDPGNRTFDLSDIPRVVGGADPVSGDLTKALFAYIIKNVVVVSSARVAEAAKLLENVFRAVNIALVNELKIIYDRMGIDIWEVVDAAATKPFGFMRFNPGPGWGGHCIPLDPFYLSWKAREFGLAGQFIELAGNINISMSKWVVEKISGGLNRQRRSVAGSRILLLGVAYKKDISDTRESPAWEIMSHLGDQGAELSFYDPHVATLPATKRAAKWAGMPSLKGLDPQVLDGFDAVVVVTDHSSLDYPLIATSSRLVIDTRGVYHRLFPELKHRVVSA